MGRRGPPAKPLELVKRQGNPGKQKLNNHAPEPARAKTPKTPFPLKGASKKIWGDMSEKLERLGVLAETDLLALFRYCDLQGRWLDMRARLDKEGYFCEITTEKGSTYQMVRPEVSLYNKWIPMLSKLELEFGLTPAARARIRVETPGDARNRERAKLYGNS